MPRRDTPMSRQQQAFEMLLDQQYAEYPVPAGAAGQRHLRSKKSNRTVSDKRATGKVPGFVLRESLPGSSEPTLQSTAQIEQLYSMFGDSIDRTIIKDVFSQCQHSAEAAIDELLAMSERMQSESRAGPSSGEPAQSAGTHGLSLDLL